MNDRQLDYFVAISDAGSFRKAAETLHIAQPALTRQMKQLEQDFGVPLFFRSSKGVMLTEAGLLLLERARFLRRHREQTRADVAARGTVPSGRVGFGAPPSIADILFQPLAVSYLEKYTNVQLNFFEGVGRLHEWLFSGDIDLAILPNSRLLDSREYERVEFVAEPMYVIGAKGAFDAQDEMSAEKVVQLPLILTPAPSTVRGLIDRLVGQDTRQLRIVAETESARVQKNLVAAGLGFAILPHSAVYEDQRTGQLSTCRIANWNLHRVLAWRSDRPLTAAVSRMIEHTTQIMKRLDAQGAFG
ncbi:LysR family transcriptional regulator [Aureimonas fodinaquatilis]|nr:LysR family transcriptional regulator [Aureimonas fodinaquatilis]